MHVLLAVFNGERYLQAQLDSLAAQQDVEVVLHVSDDGSTDCSRAIVDGFAGGTIHWLPSGPRAGATANFLRLLAHAALVMAPDDWVAFCDQDDIWHEDKLARAIAFLADEPAELPLAYSAATLLVSEDDRPIGRSPVMTRICSFANALVQCVAGANTLVLNRPAAQALSAACSPDVFSHDWTCYQVVTGIGGRYLHDIRPCLRYRQHAANEVGSNRGMRAAWSRLWQVMIGDYGQWNRRNAAVLEGLRHRLTPDSQRRFDAFQQARLAAWPWTRLAALARSGVYRQRHSQTLVLFIACLLGRL
ncbi:glycosyltransferase [uncultured Xylophilus sp.]|uniref:glycosyltransferase n=1 Tax=uncultured Xylophilus sp. TaxID=296832 RepID=UPI0025FD111D|nr:glycosyltransferase [uncultured Xylophilus sp.]